MNFIRIANRNIGDSFEPVVIAEIGINHEGSLDTAISMAEAAINSGAEIIKHQTHIVDDEMSMEARNIKPGHVDTPIYDIIERCSLNEDEEFRLMKYVQDKGAIFISTPFSRAAADRLERFDVPAYKIGSGECNNYPLVRHIASFGKPIILSTGMNTIESIRPAVAILRKAKIQFALLHCTNIYPTPPELVRLGALEKLRSEFSDAVIGLSDHTSSIYTCLGAVALGASIIEKHFTDEASRPGPDISSSMNPEMLQDLIEGSRTIFRARGGTKNLLLEEQATMAFAFASVVAIQDIKPGELLSEKNIWVMRPSGGDFKAADFESLLGKEAVSRINRGYQIRRIDIA